MPKRQKVRNFHACHPIMAKGGVHQKSKGAKRAAAKHDTRRKASEWLGRPYAIYPFYLRALFISIPRTSAKLTCLSFS